MGYLPIYRDDNIPCVLIVHQYSFEQIARLPFLTPVTFGRRDEDDAEAVYVTPMLKGPKYETTIAERRKPQDITIATARYWRRPDLVPDLVRWFAGEVDSADESPPPELVSRVRAVTAKPQLDTSRHRKETLSELTGTEIEPLVTDTMREMLRRNKRAADDLVKNGKPR